MNNRKAAGGFGEGSRLIWSHVTMQLQRSVVVIMAKCSEELSTVPGPATTNNNSKHGARLSANAGTPRIFTVAYSRRIQPSGSRLLIQKKWLSPAAASASSFFPRTRVNAGHFAETRKHVEVQEGRQNACRIRK